MESRPDASGAGRSPPARCLVGAATALAILWRLPTVAAHGGGHAAGEPHWFSLGALLLGAELAVGGVYLGRNRWADRPRRAAVVALVGVGVLTVGAIALV